MSQEKQRTKEQTRVHGFRLTEADELALLLLSSVIGVGRADVVRLLIRRAAEENVRPADKEAAQTTGENPDGGAIG